MELWLLLSLVVCLQSLCSFSQTCSNGYCQVPRMLSPPIQPFKTNFTAEMMCPEFQGQALCCNDDQMTHLVDKFLGIEYTFGAKAKGCDACAVNLRRMWCHFTCAPDQMRFVKSGPVEKIIDPMNYVPTEVYVMLSNFTVTERYASDLYNSCKQCAYTQSVPAMHSPHGFLQFQANNSVDIEQIYSTVYFQDSPSALELDTVPCSYNGSQAYGYPVKPCSCGK